MREIYQYFIMASSFCLDEHITCPICQDVFNQPKMLPCQHTYCFKCLEDLCRNKNGFSCPECRLLYNVPDNQVSNFPPNRFVVQLIEQVRKSKHRCSVCIKDEDVFNCSHCEKQFCKECEQKHCSLVQSEIHFTSSSIQKLLKIIEQYSSELEKSYHDARNKINNFYGKKITELEHQVAALNGKLFNLKETQSKLLFEASKLWYKEQQENEQLVKNGESMCKIGKEIIQYSSEDSKLNVYCTISEKLSHLHDKLKLIQSKQFLFVEDTAEVVICDERLQHHGEFHSHFPNACPDHLPSPNTDTDLPLTDIQIESIHIEAYKKKKALASYLATQGPGIREFQHPQSIMTDNIHNEIAILDRFKKSVLFYDETNTFLRVFHCEEIKEAINLTINPSSEQVLITDAGNKCIHVYSRHGKLIRTIGSAFSSGGNHLKSPYDIATDRQDQIYVSDSESDKIHIFSSQGWYIKSFGSTGRTNGEFRQPLGIAINYENKLLVCDSDNHRIQIFSDIGRHLLSFGSKGSNNGEFISPASIAVDSKGFICVSDRYNYRIQIFTNDGKFISFFGSHGFQDGQFLWPCKLAITSNFYIIVNDTVRKCIQIF